MAKQSKSEVTIDINALEALAGEIASIDTRISAATGSDAAVRKSVAEKLASEHSETVESIVSSIVDKFSTLDVAVLVGLQSRLDSVVSDKFKDDIDAFLDAQVEQATSGAKEDVAGLREDRKAKLESFRALQTILQTFGVDTSSVPEPKRSAGRSSSGSTSAKTGRNKEGYRYTLDGKDRPDSQNSMSSLAFYATEGCAGTEEKPERWGTAQVKEFIAAQGVDWPNQDEWSVTLPNGKVIGARRFTDEELAKFKDAEAKAEAEPSGEGSSDTTED